MGMILFESLVEKVPVPSYSGKATGRARAREIEKKWLAEVTRELGNEFELEGIPVKFHDFSDREEWVDLALEAENRFYPCNFKTGKATKRRADNLGSAKEIFVHLVLGEKIDKENKFRVKPTLPELAESAVEVLEGVRPIEERPREYFCLYHNQNDSSNKVIPVSSLSDDDFVVNRDNSFQVRFANASFDTRARTQEEAARFVARKFLDWVDAMGDPATRAAKRRQEINSKPRLHPGQMSLTEE